MTTRIAAFLMAFLLTSPAFAVEATPVMEATEAAVAQPATAHGAEAAAHGAEHASGGGTLPQFNVETVASQVFWLIVLFLITYICVKNIVLPQIGGTIDKREAHIRSELQAAGALTEKARLGQSDYESQIKVARSQAQNAINEARAKVSQMFASGEANQREAFQATRDAASEKINTSKQGVLKSMDDEARKLASELTQKILNAAPAAKKNTKAAA